MRLGVFDVAYSDPEVKGAKTTGDVAEILEEKYHIMRTFLEVRENKIGKDVADAFRKAIEAIGQGKPHAEKLDLDYSKIEAEFRDFLDAGEMEKIMPVSQPVMAARKGTNHRKKHPYAKKNKARPAFIDTGLYQASFRTWVE